MRKLSYVMLIGLMVLSLCSISFAREFYGRRKGGDRSGRAYGFNRMILSKLDLTAEQKEKIDKINDSCEIEGINIQSESKTNSVKLRSLLREKAPNREEINQLIDKIAKSKSELMKLKINSKLDVKKVLTEDQINKLDEMKSSMRFDRSKFDRERKSERAYNGKRGAKGRGMYFHKKGYDADSDEE